MLRKMSKNKLETKIVGQDTRLGTLGLYALLDAGFCGPPYDLSDLSVRLYLVGDNVNVNFYDMTCTVEASSKYYEEMMLYFEDKPKI